MRSKDVAEWMLEQVETRGSLTHQEAVGQIPELFGERFIYLNHQGNRAIKSRVLVHFRKLAAGTVAWERSYFCWRQKPAGD